MNETAQETAEVRDIDDWSDIDPEGEVVLGEDEEPDDAETASSEGKADRPEPSEDGAGTENGKPDGKEKADQFTLKHLDEVKTVSRDEVVALAQKGMDYDRIRQKYDESSAGRQRLSSLDDFSKRAGFRDIEELVDSVQASALAASEGIDRGVALERIRLERQRKSLEAASSPETQARKAEEKRKNDFLEFVSAYGDVKPEDIPKNVWEDYAKGGATLVQSYMKHENALLREKLASEEKAQDNRIRSTGSRSGAGRGKVMDKEDEMWYRD